MACASASSLLKEQRQQSILSLYEDDRHDHKGETREWLHPLARRDSFTKPQPFAQTQHRRIEDELNKLEVLVQAASDQLMEAQDEGSSRGAKVMT